MEDRDCVLLTYREAGRLVGVSRETIRKWVEDSDLPYFEVEGHRRRIQKSVLLRWIQERQKTQNPAIDENDTLDGRP